MLDKLPTHENLSLREGLLILEEVLVWSPFSLLFPPFAFGNIGVFLALC